MLNIWRQSLCLIPVFVLLNSAMAKAEPLNAAASDPNMMGWMQGFPPPMTASSVTPPATISVSPSFGTFCHFREIQATKRVGRGIGPVSTFAEALDPAIDDVTFTPIGAEEEMTWKASSMPITPTAC